MAKKKIADAPAEGTASATAPVESAPPSEPASCPPEPPQSDTNGNAERRPMKTFTYLIGRDTYAQVSIWDRPVNLRDGRSFTVYDLSLRKRYRKNGEWKSLYSWNASEVYALIHGLNQATAWVTEMRRIEEDGCPF